jgi:O-antigen ligase
LHLRTPGRGRWSPITTVFALLLLSALIILARLLGRDIRGGLLALVAFAGLGLDAVPWRLSGIPFIGIGVFLAACGAALAWNLLIDRDRGGGWSVSGAVYVLLLGGVLALLAVYSIVTPSPEPGLQKTMLFALRVWLPAIAICSFSSITPGEVRYVAWVGVLSGLILGASTLAFGSLQAERASADASISPITSARLAGLAAVFAFAFLLGSRRSGLVRTLAGGLLTIALLLVLLLSGSRGPFLAFAGAFPLTLLLLAPGSTWRRRILPAMATMAILGTLGVLALQPPLEQFGGITRVFETIGSLGSHHTERLRLAFFQAAWRLFEESGGVGAGVGAFSGAIMHPAPAYYPHNIFLEFLSEHGVPGLLLIVAIVASTGWWVRQIHIRRGLAPMEAALVAAWFYGLLNAQVSGDFPTNQPFWLTGALLWTLPVGAPTGTFGPGHAAKPSPAAA